MHVKTVEHGMAHKKTPDFECSNASKALVAAETHDSSNDFVERAWVVRTRRRRHDDEEIAVARVDCCPR